MRKYIITFEDNSEVEEGGVKYFRCTQAPWSYTSEIMISKLTPYTEPDTQQVNAEKGKIYDEARARGYQEGLFDAWEAARKIGSNSMCSLKEMGFDFGQCVVNDYNPSWFVVKNYSASECIEKIRQYEHIEKIRQCDDMILFKPGNEVVTTQGVGIVTKVTRTGVELFHKDGSTGYDKFEAVKKTGRHFPEFVELLAKMKGESNDPD